MRTAAAKASQGERVRMQIGGRRVAIVPLEDLHFLERLEDEEDLRDLRAFRAVAKREGAIPWDQVKRSLGLGDGGHEPAASSERTSVKGVADEIRVLHDVEARTWTVWFGRPEDESVCKEVGRGAVLMKDADGVVVGIEKPGFFGESASLRRVLEGGRAVGDGTRTKEKECAPTAAGGRGRGVRVEKCGSIVGVLISEEDFELFRLLLDAEEKRRDVAATREALREVESVSLEELEDELGL